MNTRRQQLWSVMSEEKALELGLLQRHLARKRIEGFEPSIYGHWSRACNPKIVGKLGKTIAEFDVIEPTRLLLLIHRVITSWASTLQIECQGGAIALVILSAHPMPYSGFAIHK